MKRPHRHPGEQKEGIEMSSFNDDNRPSKFIIDFESMPMDAQAALIDRLTPQEQDRILELLLAREESHLPKGHFK